MRGTRSRLDNAYVDVGSCTLSKCLIRLSSETLEEWNIIFLPCLRIALQLSFNRHIFIYWWVIISGSEFPLLKVKLSLWLLEVRFRYLLLWLVINWWYKSSLITNPNVLVNVLITLFLVHLQWLEVFLLLRWLFMLHGIHFVSGRT